MKKIVMALVLVMAFNCFAKTQKVVRYDNRSQDVVREMNDMISTGWNVVTMTATTEKYVYGSRTDYVIVVYEKD